MTRHDFSFAVNAAGLGGLLPGPRATAQPAPGRTNIVWITGEDRPLAFRRSCRPTLLTIYRIPLQ